MMGDARRTRGLSTARGDGEREIDGYSLTWTCGIEIALAVLGIAWSGLAYISLTGYVCHMIRFYYDNLYILLRFRLSPPSSIFSLFSALHFVSNNQHSRDSPKLGMPSHVIASGSCKTKKPSRAH